MHGLKLIVRSKPLKYDWIAVGDDDLFWQTNRLQRALSSYDCTRPILFRMPAYQTVRFELGYLVNGKAVTEDVPSGATAAGLILSKGLIEYMGAYLSWDKASIRQYCKKGHQGDDTTINYLGAFLGVRPTSLPGLTYEHPSLTKPYPEQITYHGRLRTGGNASIFAAFMSEYYTNSDAVCRVGQ